MPTKMKLHTAINEIFDNIVQKLKDQVGTDLLLEGVAEVIRGDRTRTKPRTPAIWVFGEPAINDHTPRTLAEHWTLPITIATVYDSYDPEEGYRVATELAAKARSAIINDRDLGLAYVRDVRSTRFEPSSPWHNEGNLYGAAAVIEVTFIIQE